LCGLLRLGNDDYYVYCFNGVDGSIIWSYDLGSYCYSATIFDVDGDGMLEVLCNAETLYRFYCLEPDGTLKWYYTSGGGTLSPVFGAFDIDADGVVECMQGSADKYLYCLNGLDGTLKWRYLTGCIVTTAGHSGDVDGDGLMEVTFGSEDYNVYVLEHDGTLKTSYTTGGWIAYLGSVSIDDVDGDDLLEICAASIDYNLYCLE